MVTVQDEGTGTNTDPRDMVDPCVASIHDEIERARREDPSYLSALLAHVLVLLERRGMLTPGEAAYSDQSLR